MTNSIPFTIGIYTIDKQGTLRGERNVNRIAAFEAQGSITIK